HVELRVVAAGNGGDRGRGDAAVRAGDAHVGGGERGRIDRFGEAQPHRRGSARERVEQLRRGDPGAGEVGDEVQPVVHRADGHRLADRAGQAAAAGRDEIRPGVELEGVPAAGPGGRAADPGDGDGDPAQALADVVEAVVVVVA